MFESFKKKPTEQKPEVDTSRRAFLRTAGETVVGAAAMMAVGSAGSEATAADTDVLSEAEKAKRDTIHGGLFVLGYTTKDPLEGQVLSEDEQETAIKVYQKERNLPETGRFDDRDLNAFLTEVMQKQLQ